MDSYGVRNSHPEWVGMSLRKGSELHNHARVAGRAVSVAAYV